MQQNPRHAMADRSGQLLLRHGDPGCSLSDGESKGVPLPDDPSGPGWMGMPRRLRLSPITPD